ncbi:MAG TPA: hypothetical protein VF821_05205 [Lentzea sp.]
MPTEHCEAFDGRTTGRLQQDKRHSYMASPDWDDPLAYLDAGKLFELIESNWDLFEPSLLELDVWRGRKAELLKIRHRIGHLRRPHADDLGRLQQTLRDLERGAMQAAGTYNRRHEVHGLDQTDPVIDGWVHGNHEDAERLLDHAAANYATNLRLSYTTRPWATPPEPGVSIAGVPGLLWRVDFSMRNFFLRLPEFWEDSLLDLGARDLLVHVCASDIVGLTVTFPAVEDSTQVADAIGHVFEALLRTSSWFYPRPGDLENDPIDDVPFLDYRVQTKTSWAIVHDYDKPVTIFSAQ